ncbi:MAG: AMP-binding protein, partial [Phycisphaerae bacterium]
RGNRQMAREQPATTAHWNSLPGMMLDQARRHPRKPMLRYWRNRAWQRMAWGEFAIQVAAIAAFLRARGLEPGDRVLLVSENRPEFMIADNAIMAIGAVTVPTYATNTVADHAHVLRDSGARVAIVSTRILAERVLQAAPLDLLVGMEQLPPAPAETRAIPWAELEAVGADLAMLIAEVEEIPAGRLARSPGPAMTAWPRR